MSCAVCLHEPKPCSQRRLNLCEQLQHELLLACADLWTHEQLAGGQAYRIASGVRVDVPQPPAWMQVCAGCPLSWVNETAWSSSCSVSHEICPCTTAVPGMNLRRPVICCQPVSAPELLARHRPQLHTCTDDHALGCCQAFSAARDKPSAGAQELAQAPLVQTGLLPEGFVDSCALNMYHDGSEGIQPHMVRRPAMR